MFNPTLLVTLVFFATVASSAPAGSSVTTPAAPSKPLSGSSSSPSLASSTGSAPPEFQTVAPASDALNGEQWSQSDTTIIPQPINGQLGAIMLGPHNLELERQNPDFLAPPTTDEGSVGNMKWPFSLSHNRLQTGGWARQQNIGVMPVATAMASVNMRLEAGAVRELHWHSTAEWAYILKGSVRITAINSDGQVAEDTVAAGDLWYFPAGYPHALQATNDDPDGAEFLLVFDDGNFSEDSTFSLTDWLAHVPKEALSKNFKVNTSAFDHIPSKELYIFPSAPPPPNEKAVTSPQGNVPNPFTFHLSQVKPTQLEGGTVKVVDSRTFKIATTIVGAVVTLEPGAMRELHWHPTQPEWSYFLEGTARISVFASSANARTFDYQAGDIGYVPPSFGHYVENTGNTTVTFLEIFNADLFEDISLNQWLALTPPELVKAHLGFDDATIAKLSKTKQTIVG